MARIKQIRKRKNLPYLKSGMRVQQISTGLFGTLIQAYGPGLNIAVMFDNKCNKGEIIALVPMNPIKDLMYFDKNMNVIATFE